jgi:C-terminal processing protease CtpA/Prc
MRPLARSLPPDEDWVTIRYIPLPPPGGQGVAPAPAEYTQPWLVFQPGQAGRFNPADLVVEATIMGLDDHTDDIQHIRKILFAPQVAVAEAASNGQLVPRELARTLATEENVLASRMPGVIKARTVRASSAAPGDPDYGYIRIYTFNVAEAGSFVDEFIRLVEALPHDGLIIDVRGNGGGLIYAAEELLQILSPQTIEPERAQFITTPLNLTICRNHRVSKELTGLELGPWIDSISASVQTGATYSQGFPITPADRCNAIGQRYFGPSVLITDPLCYSATDMFAAGFQDHQIGRVIGAGGATGAGGANVWSHGLLSRLMAPDNLDPGPSPYRHLPRGSDMRVAARRTTRVVVNQGDVLEDLGVKPDISYAMTRRDVLQGNIDLIDRAITELSTRAPHPLSVSVDRRPGRSPRVVVNATNATRIEARLEIAADGRTEYRWFASSPVHDGRVELDPDAILDHGTLGSIGIQVSSYDADALVARRRGTIELG